MKGDDAVRHCSLCDQNVYQLSNMSSEQVETFLLSRRSRGLRTCVRFYQRADGTLLTNDCSVGKKQKRKKQVVSVFGAALASAAVVGFGGQSDAPSPSAVDATSVEVDTTIEEHELIMGEEIAYPEPDSIEPPPQTVQGGLAPDEFVELMGDVAYDPSLDED